MRDLYKRCYPRIAAAREAGVPILQGPTQAAWWRTAIADEIEALEGIGMSPTEALGAASSTARAWVGRPES